MAEQEKGVHNASVFTGKGGVGNGSLCSGNVAGTFFAWRFGWLSGFPVEMRCGMLVLITYDVNTENAAGKTRLRKVAKQCVNYGRRVQNSVFECLLDNAQSITLKAILTDIIDPEKDSLRIYYLGNKYQTKIEHIGVDRGIAADQTLIL